MVIFNSYVKLPEGIIIPVISYPIFHVGKILINRPPKSPNLIAMNWTISQEQGGANGIDWSTFIWVVQLALWKMMDWVTVGSMTLPTEWKVIKFHGSKPPTSCCFTNIIYPLVNIQKTMEHHHFQLVNPLFLWPCSIAMLVYQRVYRLYPLCFVRSAIFRQSLIQSLISARSALESCSAYQAFSERLEQELLAEYAGEHVPKSQINYLKKAPMMASVHLHQWYLVYLVGTVGIFTKCHFQHRDPPGPRLCAGLCKHSTARWSCAEPQGVNTNSHWTTTDVNVPFQQETRATSGRLAILWWSYGLVPVVPNLPNNMAEQHIGISFFWGDYLEQAPF